MSHLHRHECCAERGLAGAGAAWLDSGLAIGLVVVDSNRPAIGAGHAHGLRKQSGAAH